MKSRSFAGFLVVAIVALVLSGCGWSTSSEGNGDVTYGSIVFNFSGTYTSINEGGRISAFTVQQRDQYITMRDNKGGSYSGHITYASSSSASTTKTYVYSFQVDGTSATGRPTSIVGTFETFAEPQTWGNSASGEKSSSKSKDSSSDSNTTDSSSSQIATSSSSSSSTSSSSSNKSSSRDKSSSSSSTFTGTTQAKMTASYVEQGGAATTFVGVSYISYTATQSSSSSSTSNSSSSSSSTSNNQTSFSSSGGE